MPDFEHNDTLRDALSGLNEDVPPMPEGLHAAWMQRLEEDKMEKNRTWKSASRFLSVAAALVFIVGGTMLTKDGLTGSPSSNGNSKDTAVYGARSYVEEGYVAEDSAPMLTMARGVTNTTAAAPAVSEKKIIRTASLTIQTQCFEESLEALRSACEMQGGWIESSSESTNSYSDLRTAYLTLRIPQDNLDAYLAGTDGLGRITSRSESANDVTASYQDTQTRLETQLALMDRLQALITESADLSDLMELENQIADTQYMIDSLQSSLNSTDRQVSYSTVSITLKEEKVAELTDTRVSFGDRIISAITVGFDSLVEFLQDMVVFLVAALPFIVIVAVVVIVIRIIKRRKK